MDWNSLLAILSTIGQLPATALVVTTFALGSIGIGIGMIFRDIPKYIYKTIYIVLNFILRLKGKEQIDVPPKSSKEENNSQATKILKIIEGGKSKKEETHEDGHSK